MKVFTVKVVGGHLQMPAGALPDGATVTVLVPDGEEQGFTLTESERAELAKAIQEADDGKTVDGWQLLRELER